MRTLNVQTAKLIAAVVTFWTVVTALTAAVAVALGSESRLAGLIGVASAAVAILAWQVLLRRAPFARSLPPDDLPRDRPRDEPY